ncbi:ABC transporter permease [Candidatus Uabimicrobium sp. HlEnr_7]|uniref:ABC transporter permease n=1 Tax=Candidatus Uabimicrobium helgolandensis TaxID=3095367 RepID=UPI0035564B78
MLRVLSIIKNTLSEAIRQPIYLIILLCGIFAVLASPYYTLFALLENDKLIKDMGMATLLVIGVLVSAFTASSVVHREIENNTLITVISKPISRPEFLVGKFIGVLLCVVIMEYLLGSMLLHVVRTKITEAAYSQTDYPVLIGYSSAILFSFFLSAYGNFFYNKPFTSSVVNNLLVSFTGIFFLLCFVNNRWETQPLTTNLDLQLIIAILLVIMATALICATAVTASTRLSTGSTFAVCMAFFLLGLFSDYVFGQYTTTSKISSIMYNIIPNLQMYWVIDIILDEKDVPLSYVYQVFGYTLLFLMAILSLAMALFQNRETN